MEITDEKTETINTELLNNFDFDQEENQYDSPEYELLRLAVESIGVPRPGQVYNGEYVKETLNHYLLDCNFKGLVQIPKTNAEKKLFLGIPVGKMLDVVITSITDNKEYSINGSVSSIYMQQAFDMLNDMEDDNYVHVLINKLNPAGYNCTIFLHDCEINAFLPQILAGVNKILDDDREKLVGQELEMCVESYVSDKGTWIVSRRKYLRQLIPAYITNLDTETLYNGRVTGSAKFGVFVEFSECLTGMIHRSNLNSEWKEKFDNISPGDEISFNVKEVIKNKKIILSQVKTESLWDNISIGQRLNGIIIEHRAFGTLIKLDSETRGLIHNSEQTSMVKELESGDKISVKILAIDRPERKIYLRQV